MPSSLFHSKAVSLLKLSLSLLLCGGQVIACDTENTRDEYFEIDYDNASCELGQGLNAHQSIRHGDILDVYQGTQNLTMFAFTLRLSGVDLSNTPLQYSDERAPKIDIGIEIPGYEEDNGYFRYVEGFPLILHEDEESSTMDYPDYVAIYIPVVFPGKFAIEDVAGMEATVYARLRSSQGLSLESSHTMTVGSILNYE